MVTVNPRAGKEAPEDRRGDDDGMPKFLGGASVLNTCECSEFQISAPSCKLGPCGNRPEWIKSPGGVHFTPSDIVRANGRIYPPDFGEL